MPSDPEFADAVIRQWTWKSPAMRQMAVAVCRLALARGAAGEFSANDLPEFEHGGGGIAGSVFGTLADQQVIAPVGGFLGPKFQQRTVKNPGGNRIGVWRLRSAGRAQALLAAHGDRHPAWKQTEANFFAQPTGGQLQRTPV